MTRARGFLRKWLAARSNAVVLRSDNRRTVAGADAHTLLGKMQLEETDILSYCRIGRAAKERRRKCRRRRDRRS
jgi:hypothetical protein